MQELVKITAATVEVTLEDGSRTKFDIAEVRDGWATFDSHAETERYVSDPAYIGQSGPRVEFSKMVTMNPELHLDITDMHGIRVVRMPPPGVNWFPEGMK